MTPEGGTQFEPGIIQRAANAVGAAWNTFMGNPNAPAWFGPNTPLPPQAPDQAKGRPWDFPVGINLNIKPGVEGVNDGIADFATLRRVSDPTQGGLDLLRGAIETRKDQLEAQRWSIKGRDGKDGGERAKAIEKALRQPDMVRTFRQWMRPLIDDLLVIDAPCVYFKPVANVPGQKFIPRVVDGATIKLLADANGETPLPPDPAYQQIIKGLTATDYTLEELLYMPRNVRSYRFYGMSPVEQVLGIANIALKRQLSLLNYFTDGTVPDAVLEPPPEWNPDQIKAAQNWLDQLSDSRTRRKIRILPGGKFTQTKNQELKGEFDEWLARIICWCFSLSPGSLVKDQTKATAGTNAQTAKEEGLEPYKNWFKDLMDVVISRCFEGGDTVEFAWKDEEITDAVQKMTVWTGYKNAGIVTADEIRTDVLGKEPLSEDQKAELAPPPPLAMGAFGKPGEPGKTDEPQGADGKASAALPPDKEPKEPKAEKVEKKKASHTVLKPIQRERAAVAAAVDGIKKAFNAHFAHQKKAIIAAIQGKAEKLAKMTGDEFVELWDSLSDDQRETLRKKLVAELSTIGRDGAQQAVLQVLEYAPKDSDIDAMLSQANEQAVAFAEERAAELVGMKQVDGEWIANPNPEWSIDETTRENLRELTTKAMDEGWSNDELADAIRDSEAFSDSRSEMIARTETAFADVNGNLAGWKESGVVEGKEWIVGEGCCEDCQEMNGKVVGIDEEFPEGDPPLHPSCFLPGTVVSAAGVSAHFERWFEGEIVRIFIEGQDEIAVTPNHPILTGRGWVSAGELDEADYLVHVADPGAFIRFCNPQDNHIEARIEEIADSLPVPVGMTPVSVPMAAEHFHGDGIPGQKVGIVRANGGLDITQGTSLTYEAPKPRLVITDSQLESFACSGNAASVSVILPSPPAGFVCSFDPGGAGITCRPAGLDGVCLAVTPDGKTSLSPSLPESAAVAVAGLSQINATLSSFVSLVKVQKLVKGKERWSGHVYNLETEGGWYVAGSIIAHNCRCDLLPVLSPQDE